MLAYLEKRFARQWLKLRIWYFSRRLRPVSSFLNWEGRYIGAACPHEVRIPMEAVNSLPSHKKEMLTHLLIDTVRPAGATLHICRRCYSLTRSTIKQTNVGY